MTKVLDARVKRHIYLSPTYLSTVAELIRAMKDGRFDRLRLSGSTRGVPARRVRIGRRRRKPHAGNYVRSGVGLRLARQPALFLYNRGLRGSGRPAVRRSEKVRLVGRR